MWIYLIVFLIPLLFFFADNKKNRSNSTVLFVYFLFWPCLSVSPTCLEDMTDIFTANCLMGWLMIFVRE